MVVAICARSLERRRDSGGSPSRVWLAAGSRQLSGPAPAVLLASVVVMGSAPAVSAATLNSIFSSEANRTGDNTATANATCDPDLTFCSTAIGAGADATGVASTALASESTASGTKAIAIGGRSTAAGLDSIALGTSASAVSTRDISIGESAGVGSRPGRDNLAIGAEAGQRREGSFNIALGYSAGEDVNGDANVALGRSSGQNVRGPQNVGIGANAGRAVTGASNAAVGDSAGTGVTGSNNSAFGRQAGRTVVGNQNTGLGNGAGFDVTGDNNTAIGLSAGSTLRGDNNVALGVNAAEDVNGDQNVGIGNGAGSNVEGDNNVAIGNLAGTVRDASGRILDVTVNDAVSIGNDAVASANQAIAIGPGAKASGEKSISIGVGNEVSGASSGAIGDPTVITGTGSYSLGNDNTIDADSAGTFGNDNKLAGTADGSRIVGNGNDIDVGDAFVLGNTADVTVGGGVALGSNSISDTAAVDGYVPGLSRDTPSKLAIEATKSTNGAVAVGNPDAATPVYRQITGVAAGTEDSDAANIAQLKSVETIATEASKGWNLVLEGDDGSRIAPGGTLGLENSDGNLRIVGVSNDENAFVDIGLANDVRIQDSITVGGDDSGAPATVISGGSIMLGDTMLGTEGLVITGGPSVTTKGIDAGGMKITNVADGMVAAGSKDAINGGQLHSALANVNANVNANGVVYDDAEKGTVTLKGVDGTRITNLAAGEINEDSTDAVNGSQLHDTNVKVDRLGTQVTKIDERVTHIETFQDDIENAVAYDTDAAGKKLNTVTLKGGDPNQPVLVANVAKGVKDTDAANVGQLKEGIAETKHYTDEKTKWAIDQSASYTDTVTEAKFSAANRYTDQKFSQLSGEIGEVRGEARQAAAIGLAASSLRFDDRPGKLSVALGGGIWRSEAALAFGAGYTSENGRMRANLTGTAAGGHVGVGAGVSITLN